MAPTDLATGHVGLNVTDLARSRAFYTRVFGFEVLGEGSEEGRGFAFLGRAGRLVLTLWQQARGPFDRTASGLHHLSFEVGTLEEVRAAERELRELSVEFAHDGVVPHGEGASSGGIFFHDPDGIRLEIYAPAGAEALPAPAGDAPACGFF
ncbi:VOC family protein [Nocardiopsis flavescens]|uniref:VOC family protein n=1 Tax=Nocardiopsis flavescens TaxID=758803 RepID=UPI003669B6B3